MIALDAVAVGSGLAGAEGATAFGDAPHGLASATTRPTAITTATIQGRSESAGISTR